MAEDGSDDHVTFRLKSTAADQAAFLLYASRRPSRLALQLALFAAMGLFFLVLQVALDVVGALLTAERGTMGAAVRSYFTSQIHRNLAETLPWVGLAVAGLFILNLFVFLPRQCRLTGRRIIDSYPEIATGDSKATFAGSLHLDAKGVTSTTPNERFFLAWPLFVGLVETRHFLYIMTSASTALVLPKHAVDTADLARVRELCARFLAPAEARP